MKNQLGLAGALALVLVLLITMAGLTPISARPASASTNPRAPRADFDGDGYGDLAVGVLSEDVGSPEVEDAGTVNVLYGSWSGLSGNASQTWNQDNPVIPDQAEESDWFGQVLAAGDFDGDRRIDLAVGIPSKDDGAVINAGQVNVLYGSGAGLYTGERWYQGDSDVPGTSETDDYFGSALAAGDAGD